PGGKSLFIADLLEAGRIVAVDEPGKRLERLKENLGRIKNVDVALVQSNLLNAEPMLFKELGLPTAYDAVLIDVPCSNTGVMRHRVDAKWRLREADIAQHAAQQLELLFAAARLVAPGGRIVYSTCSLEKEENEGVISKFLRARGKDFSQENRALSRPWETGHDGSGVFLLSKKK
ncbi:MAG TPA: RNA methyltransferase, partial [Opitutaceae bacterium]|nr:RNA methyltransferase [Opitutaceae bacterium]